MSKNKNNELNSNIYFQYAKGLLIGIAVTLVFIFAFALIFLLIKSGREYAGVAASVSLAAGAFSSAFLTAKKLGEKGYLVGLIIGGIFFLAVTVISFIVNRSGLTVNSLFKLIIILLSAFIGGVFGVNKSVKKYI